MFTITPLLARTLRKLGWHANYRSAAVRKWMLEPASTTVNVPAFYDERELAKVNGVPPHTSHAYQLERLTREVTHCPPVHAHLLRDVVMVDGHLFRWNMVQPLADHGLPGISTAPLPDIDTGVLASTEYGNRFFGHWLLDDMPLAMAARELGDAYGHLGRDNRPSPHQADYAQMFRPDVRYLRNARFRELIIIDEMP